MVLFQTPTSTASSVFSTVSDTLSKPGLKGLAIILIALVATFWVIEMLIGKFQKPPVDNNHHTPDN